MSDCVLTGVCVCVCIITSQLSSCPSWGSTWTPSSSPCVTTPPGPLERFPCKWVSVLFCVWIFITGQMNVGYLDMMKHPAHWHKMIHFVPKYISDPDIGCPVFVLTDLQTNARMQVTMQWRSCAAFVLRMQASCSCIKVAFPCRSPSTPGSCA